METKNIKEVRQKDDCIILQYNTKEDATAAYFDEYKKHVTDVAKKALKKKGFDIKDE